ncbi:hypothetical protein N7516_009935, partial [Penicillium verrucosum]|uniref:uncharacterized protein n=1 Tax=Penicillium verrucosum TaxID=60171 RepID=UPI00254556A0
SFGLFSRILPSPIRNYLFVRRKSNDIKSCGYPLTENNSPAVVKNHVFVVVFGAADVSLFIKDIKRSFEVKERLFDILGTYISISKEPRRLLFSEASDIEAVYYIYQKGVIYSDLRLENLLLHSDSKSKLNLLLYDFRGSTNSDIDSRYLPDSGFFNPYKL